MVWPRLAKNHQDLMKKLAEDPEAFDRGHYI